ncbi:MAG TPA: hypothetical protein VIV11_35570, partial [Kofleriaceae bacterium]
MRTMLAVFLLLPALARADCPGPTAADATVRIGLRSSAGFGVAREGMTDVSLTLHGAMRVAPRWFGLVRAGWSRRHAISERDGLDAALVGAGVSAQLATTSFAVLELGMEARAELRFDERFAGGSVRRVGASADASLGVAFERIPLVIGLRVEQGVTPLVDDVRA